MNGFYPQMNGKEANSLGMLALAHVGDAVYELLVRSALCAKGPAQVKGLHRRAVSLVRASAQAEAAGRIAPLLTPEELALYKRGRNAKVHSVPHNADIGQYHSATGFEALLGWLYMQGNIQRINELFAAIMEGVDDAT